ncbi:uncharacterized protein [Pyrus communis]|uniref:uncharacterized protein n=1 Tax=Pyrus communis TaxID=23211 RepID=UPI0035BFCBB8
MRRCGANSLTLTSSNILVIRKFLPLKFLKGGKTRLFLSKEHKYRLQCYYTEPGFGASGHFIGCVVSQFISLRNAVTVFMPSRGMNKKVERQHLKKNKENFKNQPLMQQGLSWQQEPIGLNIEAYDAVCMQRLGWSAPRVTAEPAEGELAEHRPVIPYLYIFYDSDCSE